MPAELFGGCRVKTVRLPQTACTCDVAASVVNSDRRAGPAKRVGWFLRYQLSLDRAVGESSEGRETVPMTVGRPILTAAGLKTRDVLW